MDKNGIKVIGNKELKIIEVENGKCKWMIKDIAKNGIVDLCTLERYKGRSHIEKLENYIIAEGIHPL